MESEYDEEEFESASLFSPELIFSVPVVINGIKTDISFNYCKNGEDAAYIAVNLVRGGSCVNSFTMNCDKGSAWQFVEDYVPKELRALLPEFNKQIGIKMGYFSA